MAQDLVTLAAIIGAHGVTGEVRLKLFGEGLEALRAHKSFNDGALTLIKLRPDNKGGAIARFAQATRREAAEQLRGTVLSVPRAALPPLGEDEYYHADLIGLAVENFGASDIIEIERDPPPAKGPRAFMVPMTREAVLGWDAQRLVIAAAFAED